MRNSRRCIILWCTGRLIGSISRSFGSQRVLSQVPAWAVGKSERKKKKMQRHTQVVSNRYSRRCACACACVSVCECARARTRTCLCRLCSYRDIFFLNVSKLKCRKLPRSFLTPLEWFINVNGFSRKQSQVNVWFTTRVTRLTQIGKK